MKVVKERILHIRYVTPENESEKTQIRKIIEDVSKEKPPISKLKKAKPGQEVG